MEQVQSWIKGNKWLSVIIGIAAILLVTAGWYFLYWVKTPSYSLGLIKTAVAQHDLAAFQKHVDTDTLIGSVYDDAMGYYMEKDGMNNPLTMGFVSAMKPALVGQLKTEIETYVQTGHSEGTQDEKQKVDPKAENFTKRTGIKNASFVKIDKTEVNGQSASVYIIVRDAAVEKDFTVQIGMEKLEDGTWKLNRVLNLKEYLAKYEEAKAAKLQELNQPIREKLVALVDMEKNPKLTMESKTVFGFTDTAMKIPFHFKVNSDSNISHLVFHITLTDESGNTLLETDSQINQVLESGKTYSFTNTGKLNPFIERDQKVAALGADHVKVALDVVSVTNGEGTTALLKELPTEEKQK